MIQLAIKYPYVVMVAALATLVLGITSFQRIPADLLPIFKTPAVQIVTFYPGMPPEVMERDIMSRLERWTGQSVGIEHQEAKAMLGVSVVKDFFREGISLETAMSQVTSYAMSDMFYLPRRRADCPRESCSRRCHTLSFSRGRFFRKAS